MDTPADTATGDTAAPRPRLTLKARELWQATPCARGNRPPPAWWESGPGPIRQAWLHLGCAGRHLASAARALRDGLMESPAVQRGCLALVAIAVLAAVAMLASGCGVVGKKGAAVAPAITAMQGGAASGSGATLVTPTAAAGPSEQHAIEEETYAPPEPAQDVPAPVPEVVFHPSPYDVPAQHAVPVVTAPAPAPRLLHRRSETTTKIGAHQEISPMLKQVGGVLESINKAQWLGILAILVGIGGLLHSAGNKESGYPAVWLKVIGGGTLALVMGDAWWFWVLLALAGLSYLGQKFGVIRIPAA